MSFISFSRKGLIDQLVYGGFTISDATYGVDSQNADWNLQAAKKAKSYLALTAFSYSALVDQLVYEGFTQSQASYGVSTTGLTGLTPTPTPTPTSAPSSAPTQSPTNTAENAPGVCTVSSEPAYPIASQRISILGIQWVKDALGYLTANVRMRNDNTMNLRLVEFTFNYWDGFTRKNTSYNTGTSIVPNHFVKDDPQFMGIEQIAGSWTPGQVRTFALQTNAIINCSTLRFTSSDFVVSLGVGG